MSTSSTTSIPQGTPRSLLVTWVNQQDAWIRELVSDIIVTGKPVSDERVEELYDLFLREKGLRDGDPVVAHSLRDDSFDSRAAEPLVLNRLEDLENVNALTGGQCISFTPKLTIIFGENASGKTGYVRVLKRVAGVRTSEPVLPNMNASVSAAVTPSAKLTYTFGAQQKTASWHDEAGIAPLNRIDVFDARVSALHVDADLAYIYTPGELARFPLVQQGIDQARGKLDREIRDVLKMGNPFVTQFDRASRFYTTIESLGAASDVLTLRTLSAVSEVERSQVTTLRTEIDALRSSTPQAQQKLAETQRQHLGALLRAVGALNAFDPAACSRAIDELDSARREYDRASHSSFAELPIPGILLKEWQNFVHAAEEYLQHQENAAAHLSEGDACPYCRQPLGVEAVALLQKYRDYCNGEFRAALKRAQDSVDRITATLRLIDTTNLRQRLAEIGGGGTPLAPELVTELNDVLSKFDELTSACDAGRLYVWPDRAQQATRLQTALQTIDRSLTVFLTDLKDRTEKRQRTLREREAQLLDIESRSRLAGLLPEIEKFVGRAKWAYQAQIQSGRFQGILRSLTDTAKAASEELLNRDFERRFTNECTTLQAPKVQLLFPGKEGQVSRRKA